MKLLLHTCCAPCSVYCVKALRANDIEPTLYWYNPNIHPYQEYKARRDCLREYAKTIKVNLLEDDAYGLDEFVCNTYDKIATRCQDYCYPKRLRQAFEFAKANGFDTITTTLLYSIYQKHDYIKELMQNLSAEYGIKFYYQDFREGWREGQDEGSTHRPLYAKVLRLRLLGGGVIYRPRNRTQNAESWNFSNQRERSQGNRRQ